MIKNCTISWLLMVHANDYTYIYLSLFVCVLWPGPYTFLTVTVMRTNRNYRWVVENLVEMNESNSVINMFLSR
jgi:hypothetical protein